MNLFYSNFNKSDSDIILDEIDSKHLSKSLRKKLEILLELLMEMVWRVKER